MPPPLPARRARRAAHAFVLPYVVLAVALLARPALAEPNAELRRALASVGVDEKLGAPVPLGLVLRENDGRPLPLASLAGAPVLLSFNYTSCARLCSVQLAGLSQALRALGGSGAGFSILTVSIDPAETDAQLVEYEKTYVRQAGGGAPLGERWRFASGTPDAVEALARAVGFRYRYDPRSGEFAHQATLVVLGPDGRVSSYLHGVRYEPDALRAALARAGAGRIATAEEQASLGGFLLACMGFDPGDPLPLALKIMRAGGVAVLLFLALFGAHALRGSRLRRTRTSP